MDENSEPKTQTENSGGDGPRGKTRIGASMPGDGSKKVQIDQELTVKQLARKLRVSEVHVIKHLFKKSICRTVNQIVELNTARDVAFEMGFEVTSKGDPSD